MPTFASTRGPGAADPRKWCVRPTRPYYSSLINEKPCWSLGIFLHLKFTDQGLSYHSVPLLPRPLYQSLIWKASWPPRRTSSHSFGQGRRCSCSWSGGGFWIRPGAPSLFAENRRHLVARKIRDGGVQRCDDDRPCVHPLTCLGALPGTPEANEIDDLTPGWQVGTRRGVTPPAARDPNRVRTAVILRRASGDIGPREGPCPSTRAYGSPRSD